MSIQKVAIALAALVIIGLVIFALIKFVLPGVFNYVKCAIGTILDPAQGKSMADCTKEITDAIKLGS